MLNKINERMTAAKALLGFLAHNEYPAVICGGYARDTICGRPIRDVDVYVCISMFHGVAKALGNADDCEFDMYDETDPAYQHQSIVKQLTFNLHADLVKQFGLETDRINLIGVNDDVAITVEDVTSRFNLALCQAGIAIDHPYVSDQFKSDFNDEQITLLRTDWGYEATMKQFIKLQSKYNWPLRVRPEDLEALI